jgi:hypothetical protein
MLHSYEYEVPSWRAELVTRETVDDENLHDAPFLDSPEVLWQETQAEEVLTSESQRFVK